jgi:hypothetical protein
MWSTRSAETINKRCELLENLGFAIDHEDSNVSLGEFSFDFSAIELTTANIIKMVANEALKAGILKGQNDLKMELKRLLEPLEPIEG